MAHISRCCYLRCLLDSHEPIKLIHNAETIIGRSKITKIKDPSCSRQQLSLLADCNECLVQVKQLGINASGLDGFALCKNATYKVGHGSRIEVLLNNYIHTIEFDPPPVPSSSNQQSNKRKLEENIEAPTKRKSLKIDHDIESQMSYNKAEVDSWEEVDRGALYIFSAKGVTSSPKIGAFDMDGTLIHTKSGKVHPVDINDWQIAFHTVQNKLQEHYQDGYKLVILSNQAPIGNGRVKIEDFKIKIENLVSSLGVPMQVYLATGKGIYRKPAPGMWQYLEDKKNDGIKIDMVKSFYVGDAVGRAANWAPGKKKDFSMADKLMAENVNVKFYTPEQFFLGHSISNIPMNNPEFVPKDLVPGPFNDRLISSEREILVLVGYPGSGKSFIASQIEKISGFKYAVVCRDDLGSWQKCAAEATKLLNHCKSVVVDSTNPDKESRARWVSLAKKMNVICRCAKLTTSMAHARHNNKFREIMNFKHVPVNDIVFHTYKKKYEEPTIDEGFKEVIDVHFTPCFDNKEAERFYKMHLLEK